jgi:hypothetical protein
MSYRTNRDQAIGGDLEGATTRMLEARQEVNAAFDELQTLVRNELASL